MQGYRKSTFGLIVFVLLSIFSFGIYLLLARWYPRLYVWLAFRKCSIDAATMVFIVSSVDKGETICNVQFVDVGRESMKYFPFRHCNYVFCHETGSFERMRWNLKRTTRLLHEYATRTDYDDQSRGKMIFGKNSIEVAVKNILFLLLDEVLTPFYIFQLFSIIVWLIELYWIYATSLLIVSSISAAVSLYQTRKNLMNLKEMSKSHCNVVRISGFIKETVDSSELLPGDIIQLEKNFTLPCDGIVLSGQSIMNESMLTGESIPVIKSSLPKSDDSFSTQDHRSSVLFSGTNVLDCQADTIALVTCTGFATAKGKLILSILYPKPNSFRFYADSLKFVAVMFGLGLCGMIYAVTMLSLAGASIFTRIIRMLDVITISVPPALPLAMSVGISYAVNRLSYQKIFCISPPRVNIAGMIELVAFDKTGTLTEEGLDLMAVRPCKSSDYEDTSQNEDITHDICVFDDEIAMSTPSGAFGEMIPTIERNLAQLMGSCHGISHLDGKLVGDPLELKIFESTGDIIQNDGVSIAHGSIMMKILKRHDFSSSLHRMSVIVSLSESNVMYCKGSPEMISSLCKSLPENFQSVLNVYTSNGYRVIACAMRDLSDNLLDVSREDLEKDLKFLGFCILENKIKPTTKGVIGVLSAAKIQNVMITGDNPLTAIHIGRQSGIIQHDEIVFLSSLNDGRISWKSIDSDDTINGDTLLPDSDLNGPYVLAITGPALHYYLHHQDLQPNIILGLLLKCKIFSRMLPDQKMRIVEEFQNAGKFCSFCGDGANDVSAMKASHVGLSLSSAETSIAAPFTSLTPTIECVPIVIREGRCSLTTSFQMFKFICLYSFIQTVSVLILYNINADLADFQFLFVDLFIITPIVLTMGRTGPSVDLSREKPPVALFSVLNFASIFSQIFLAILFQVFVWFDLKNQSWFVPHRPSSEIAFDVVEVTAIFMTNVFQTLNVAICYSLGRNFRKPIYSNCMVGLILI